MREGFIPPHGGYQDLQSYRKSLVVYQATRCFCRDFFDKYDRTIGQMVQAARSGKQNIIEGSAASGTSKETEIKLTNVARASLEELLEDYRDFMRDRDIREWDKSHPYARRLGELCRMPDSDYATFRSAVEHKDPAIRANAIVGLIKVANFLLDQQIRRLEQDFLKEGGLREGMTRTRIEMRNRQRREGRK
jgi:four helix bundle suffix protein